MRIELRPEAGGADAEYARGLAAGLRDLGVEVVAGRGRAAWRRHDETVVLGIGRPNPRRRADAWIWLEAGGDGIVPSPRPPTAIAAMDVPERVGLEVLPFPVLPCFYAPGDGGAVFRVARRFHLEDRPRVVMFGPYADGRGISAAFEAVAGGRIGPGGELVLFEGTRVRAGLAPAVQHLGLAGRVVFLPELTPEEAAGVLLGADLAILPEAVASFPFWIPWCHASGVPVVALDTPVARHAAGAGALLVDARQADGIGQAMRDVLGHEALRRELLHRGARQAARARAAAVGAAVLRWLSAVVGPEH